MTRACYGEYNTCLFCDVLNSMFRIQPVVDIAARVLHTHQLVLVIGGQPAVSMPQIIFLTAPLGAQRLAGDTGGALLVDAMDFGGRSDGSTTGAGTTSMLRPADAQAAAPSQLKLQLHSQGLARGYRIDPAATSEPNSHCCGCQQEFGIFLRPSQCRLCGLHFCAGCASHRVLRGFEPRQRGRHASPQTEDRVALEQLRCCSPCATRIGEVKRLAQTLRSLDHAMQKLPLSLLLHVQAEVAHIVEGGIQARWDPQEATPSTISESKLSAWHTDVGASMTNQDTGTVPEPQDGDETGSAASGTSAAQSPVEGASADSATACTAAPSVGPASEEPEHRYDDVVKSMIRLFELQLEVRQLYREPRCTDGSTDGGRLEVGERERGSADVPASEWWSWGEGCRHREVSPVCRGSVFARGGPSCAVG